MREICMTLLEIVIMVCMALIVRYVVPYVKTLAESTLDKRVYDKVVIAVKAAEQVFKDHGLGKTKKADVLAFVNSWLKRKHIEITEAELDKFVEAAVFALNNKDDSSQQDL